MRQVEDEFVP